MKQQNTDKVTEVKESLNRGENGVNKTPETRWKPSSKLTPKQNRFVQYVVTHPKESATSAVVHAYNVKSRSVANAMVQQLHKKPAVMAELAKYSTQAELTVLEVMEYSKDYGKAGGKEGASYAGVALQAANSVLDRLHGKATQRTENATVAVTLNVNLAETA